MRVERLGFYTPPLSRLESEGILDRTGRAVLGLAAPMTTTCLGRLRLTTMML